MLELKIVITHGWSGGYDKTKPTLLPFYTQTGRTIVILSPPIEKPNSTSLTFGFGYNRYCCASHHLTLNLFLCVHINGVDSFPLFPLKSYPC